MTAQLAPSAIFRSWDNLGLPLVGGKLNTYAAGTTNLQATYTDSTQGTPNTNPVILNFRGEAFVWLDPTLSYKFVLTDAFNNTIWTEDNIPGGFGANPLSANLIPNPSNTFTLGNSTRSWAQLYLGANASPALDTVSGIIGYYPRTPTEIAASVTPTSFSYPFGDPRRYGAAWDGVTNDTTAFAKCVAVGLMLVPPGTGVGTLSIQKSNMAIIGPGSAFCTIKNPAGALSTGGVIEVGNTALGNSAPTYSGFSISGVTIDGNRAAATAPTDDLRGHGIPLTKVSQFFIRDVYVKNCWNAGVGIFINSNFGTICGQSFNCGNATFTPPGLDINASKHLSIDWISDADNVGFRILQNCNNINAKVDVYSAAAQGVIVQSIAPNLGSCFQINLDITVDTTVSQGLLIQESIRNSNFRATIINAGTIGCHIPAGSSSAADCIDNDIVLHTENSQQQGMLDFSRLSRVKHTSRLDGVSGAAGSYFALDVNNNNNVYESIVDGNAQVRSVAVRAGATGNVFLAWTQTNCLSGFSDAGTNTTRVPLTYETTFNGTFNLTSGAAPTIVTAAVTGVAFGDQIQVAWPSNLQGAIAWAYVQSAGNVSVAAYNITGGALNFGAITVTLRITKL